MRRLTIVLLTLAMTGCNAPGPDDEAVLAEADKLANPLPGLYRSTTTFGGLELPGADADQARVARDRMAGLSPQVSEFCLTPAEAEGGFRAMLQAMQEGDCAFDRFETLDGRLSADMRCTATSGVISKVAMAGEADPQSSQLTLSIDQTGDAIPGGRMRMSMKVVSERTGDCPSKPAGG